MDFSTITQIAIPEGTVTQIHQGDTLLWQRHSLPAGYRQLAYIETDGNQYIDTEVKASSYPEGLSYEFRGQITGYTQTSGNNYLFGCLQSSRRGGNICIDTRVNIYLLTLFIGASGSQIFGTGAPHGGSGF